MLPLSQPRRVISYVLSNVVASGNSSIHSAEKRRCAERELVVSQGRLFGKEGILESREGQPEPAGFEFAVDQAQLRIVESLTVQR